MKKQVLRKKTKDWKRSETASCSASESKRCPTAETAETGWKKPVRSAQTGTKKQELKRSLTARSRTARKKPVRFRRLTKNCLRESL